MRDHRGLRRAVVGALLGAVVLTGCSEKKQEANDTLPSSSAAETSETLPEIGPADFPVPDEARTKDAAGAEAFVRYYIALINRTLSVMDAQPLKDLSDGCEDCERIAGHTEDAVVRGDAYEGGEITIREVGSVLLKGDTAELPLRIDQAGFFVVDSAGLPTEGGTPAVSDVLGGVALTYDATRQSWVINDLTFG